jgi:membrane fusion protein (multidrug efflux system)
MFLPRPRAGKEPKTDKPSLPKTRNLLDQSTTNQENLNSKKLSTPQAARQLEDKDNMLKRMLIMIAGLMVVFGGVFGWKWYVGRQLAEAMESGGSPPVTVSATIASNAVWHPELPAVATLRAVQGTEVSPQVAGQVSRIAFESGEPVKRADLLVQLDVSVEQAALDGLEAELALAKVEYERRQELAGSSAVSQSELDQAEASFKKARAAVDHERELIDKKTIRAPFSGRLGIREVNLGDYLAAGAKIVTLQTMDPIYAEFSLPQDKFGQVQVGQPVTLEVDAYPGHAFQGKVTAINSKVTQSTRNFEVQATLENPRERLQPGMFGEISVQLPQQNNVITLPDTAIAYNPYGDSVYILEAKGTNDRGQALLQARRAFVQIGEERGTQVSITKGVKVGQQVVTSGQMKLQEDSVVIVNNDIQVPNEASVTPEDE